MYPVMVQWDTWNYGDCNTNTYTRIHTHGKKTTNKSTVIKEWFKMSLKVIMTKLFTVVQPIIEFWTKGTKPNSSIVLFISIRYTSTTSTSWVLGKMYSLFSFFFWNIILQTNIFDIQRRGWWQKMGIVWSEVGICCVWLERGVGKLIQKRVENIYSLTNPPRRVIFSYGVLMSVGKVLMKKSWASHFENSLILIYLSWCFILIPRWNNFHKFVEAIPIATIVHSQTNPHWLIKIFSKAKPDCMDLFWGYIQLIDPDKFDMICDKIGRMKTL